MPVFTPVDRLAVLIDRLTPSQLLHALVRSFEKIRSSHPGMDVALIARNRQPFECVHKIPVLAMHSAWAWDGVLVATSAATAGVLDSCGLAKQQQRFLYAWDLEWTREVRQAEEWFALYRSPHRNLVCRSEEHSRVIEDCFNLPSRPSVVGQGEDTLLKIWNLSRE